MKELIVNKAISELTKPEHPVLVISGRTGKKINIMPAGWVTRTSFDPPLMLVSVGFTRYTHTLLNEYKEFILAYPVKGMENIINVCGSTTGREIDKLEKVKPATEPGLKTSLPLLTKARVNFECKVIDSMDTGDHTVFIGMVLRAAGNPDKSPLINTGNYKYREFKA